MDHSKHRPPHPYLNTTIHPTKETLSEATEGMSMKTHILVFASPTSDFLPKLLRSFDDYFEDYGIVCYILGEENRNYNRLCDQGVIEKLVSDKKVGQSHHPAPDMSYLKDIEDETGTLWPALFADRKMSKDASSGLYHFEQSPHTHDELLANLENRIRVLDSLFKEHQFAFVYGANLSRLPVMLGYEIGESRNVPFFRVAPTRIENHFRVHESIYEHSQQVHDVFQEVKTNPSEFPIERAERYVEHVQSGGKLYNIQAPSDGSVSSHQSPSFSKAVLNILRNIYRQREQYFKKDYYYSTPGAKKKYHRNKNKIRRWWQEYNDIFDDFDPNQQYIYFPLQVQPEQSLMVWARYLTDLPNIIYNLAQSVPVGTEVYVNEHPNMFGARESIFYDRCRRLPNVRVFSPEVDTNKIIDNAEAVATVTSSIGLQAAIRDTPVVTLSDPSYSIMDSVRTVDSPSDMYMNMIDAIDNGIDREELLSYITANFIVGFPRDNRKITRYACEYIQNSIEHSRDEAWRKTRDFAAEHTDDWI
jgi:hypothetical protein